MSSSEYCRRAIFQIYNVLKLKITRIKTFRNCNVVYQAGSRWDLKCVFNFLCFFERKLYKSNYIIFILSWCGTHTKIMSKLVDIVTAGSQKITLWGPQRNLLGILRVNDFKIAKNTVWKYFYFQGERFPKEHCFPWSLQASLSRNVTNRVNTKTYSGSWWSGIMQSI